MVDLKRYLVGILIAVIALISCFMIDSCNRGKSALNELKTHKEYSDTLEASVLKYWIDEYNREHAIAEDVSAENGRLTRYVDSISSLLKIKSKQVLKFSQVTSNISLNEKLNVDSTTQIILCPEDSISTVKQLNFSWRDPWMKVTGTIGDNDSIHISGIDTLSRVDYWKRKWFLGAKHYYTDISNTNPHIYTAGYKGMEFKPTKQNWSIGLGTQVGYPLNQPIIFNKPVFSLGINVQRTIIRF